MKERLRSLLGRALRGHLEIAAIAVAAVIAILGYATTVASGGIANLLTNSPLILSSCLGVLIAVGGVVMAKLIRYRRLWLTSIERHHTALAQLLRHLGTDAREGLRVADATLKEIAARQKDIAARQQDLADATLHEIAARQRDIATRQQDFAERQQRIERFAKYTTDLLLAPAQPEDESRTLEGWPYGLNNQNTVRNQVQFARELEASRIRELYLKEIFPEIETVSLPIGAINELSGHPNKVDLLYVCAIAKMRRAKQIFEFGTYQGRTTYHLALATAETHVTTLDLPPDPNWAYSKYNGIYFRGTAVEARITQLFHDSRELDTRPIAKSFDFVFVDADHSYDAVKNDTHKAFELLHSGGVILWHDYAPKSGGLVRFFREFTQQRPLFRIKRTCLLIHIDGIDPMTFEAHPMIPSLELAYEATDTFQVEQIYHQ